MKSTLPTLTFILFATAAAYAQEQPVVTDSIIERVYPVETYKPPMSAADSARELARRANARRILRDNKTSPGIPPSPNAGHPVSTLPPPPPPAPPVDPKVLAKEAKRREAAAKKAAEANQKREKTLYKRAKRS